MAKMCAKCSDAINGIDYVVCRGYCGATFYLNNCSGGVTRAMLSYFTTHRKNLFWMCDNCADLFENAHFRAISTRADEQSPLSTLTTAISELRNEIKQINAKPSPQLLTPNNNAWPSLDWRRPSKRLRNHDTATRASETCLVGSKQPLADVVSVPICDDNRDQKFWLYLSRIRPDVANDAVCAMVKANLALDANPEVVKLVAKEKDINTLSFVSFKIGLDPSLKTKALNPNTWPEGLLFREFEDYAQKFRFPLKSRRPMTPLLHPQDTSPAVTPVMDLS